MANYIKGNAVANASGYELRKKTTLDGNTAYVHIDTKRAGMVSFQNKGYIDSNGQPVSSDFQGLEFRRTDMFHINDLSNDENEECCSRWSTNENVIAIAAYSRKDDYSSFVAGYRFYDFSNTRNAETLKKIIGDYYVVFVQANPQILVSLKNDLNFRLDDYSDKLEEGQTHTLVVRAIGDGVNYSNSDYSNEINYTA